MSPFHACIGWMVSYNIENYRKKKMVSHMPHPLNVIIVGKGFLTPPTFLFYEDSPILLMHPFSHFVQPPSFVVLFLLLDE